MLYQVQYNGVNEELSNIVDHYNALAIRVHKVFEPFREKYEKFPSKYAMEMYADMASLEVLVCDAIGYSALKTAIEEEAVEATAEFKIDELKIDEDTTKNFLDELQRHLGGI